MTEPAPLSDRVLQGDPRAVARAISLIEDESPQGAALVRRIFPSTGKAYLIGITGSPGAGKSTLVDRLIGELRRSGRTIGVIAVDPTSPYTGGAILGDRVRMQAHVADSGVFIRSMATRGNLGGLARATAEAALVLDAAGKDIVLIETVGVGQDEVDIVRTADISIVTVVPGTGDEVQALKAGIMEIADIFVVNKADREGADRTVASIEATVRSAPSRSALLTTKMSAISMIPALSACTSSPAPGTRVTIDTSAVRTMSTSSWPTPTVSMRTTSLPEASRTSAASAVARASPPRWPRVAMLRMKTPLSATCACMRTRSPRIAPPV